jgi:hypothetical protein
MSELSSPPITLAVLGLSDTEKQGFFLSFFLLEFFVSHEGMLTSLNLLFCIGKQLPMREGDYGSRYRQQLLLDYLNCYDINVLSLLGNTLLLYSQSNIAH